MNAYQLEALSEKLRDERTLHGPEVCIDCENGVHEVPGCSWCECACHAPLRPAQAGEIQTLSFQGSGFSRRGELEDGVPWSANENPAKLKTAGEDDARQPVPHHAGGLRVNLPAGVQSTLEF
jgi:hypothetical protein